VLKLSTKAGDIEVGRDFALEALDRINDHKDYDILLSSLCDVLDKSEDDGALAAAFLAEIARHAAYGHRILKTIDDMAPGGTVAIMKAVNGHLLAVEEVYPETETCTPGASEAA
jgi:hypothetical protein